MNIRTDLVIEAREMFAEEIAGVESLNHNSDGISVTHVKITTPEGALRIGKPMGNYVTIEIKDLQNENEELCERGAKAVCNELKKLLKLSSEDSVLIAGLGNRNITPDSVGPKTVNKLVVTRHITKEGSEGLDFDVRAVSAIAPGVLGLTGIETSEIISGITEKTKPSLIIAVDALAARSLERLGTTVQISDTGISPGSGVGNNRKAINKETFGVPVIAIGVPMVVDAATMMLDCAERVSRHIHRQSTKVNNQFNTFSDGRELISEAFSKNNYNMVVTPNDVDIIAQQASTIIAEGINMALLQ